MRERERERERDVESCSNFEGSKPYTHPTISSTVLDKFELDAKRLLFLFVEFAKR